MIDPDGRHFKRLDQYARKMELIYNQAVADIAAYYSAINNISSGAMNLDDPFTFKRFPALKQKVDTVLKKMAGAQLLLIENGVNREWDEANLKNTELVNAMLSGTPFDKGKFARYFQRNLDALEGFKQRKTAGLGLSDRIWQYNGQFKKEMEMAIDLGLTRGSSAAQLSRDVRQYLKDPDKLFRRVRDERGVLHLSKQAESYHPGRGKYRSSYKNAMRLTRTEINMAYRTADHERWQQLDFIVGFEVRLSNNHPVPDICDSLKGKYPKDFVFSGWHPQCRCHVVSIMNDQDEFDSQIQAILDDEEPETWSRNIVKDTPKGFKTWITDNEKRMENWSSLPYFLRDNQWYVAGALGKNETRKVGLAVAREALEPIANTLLDELRRVGFEANGVNYSHTDFGDSAYIYATHPKLLPSEGSTFKFRVSDHTVGTIRFLTEYHVRSMADIDRLITGFEKKLHPERFTEKIIITYKEIEVPEHAFIAATDEIIGERIANTGRKILKVRRRVETKVLV